MLYGKVLAQDAIGHGTGNTLVELLALHKDLCQPSPARRNATHNSTSTDEPPQAGYHTHLRWLDVRLDGPPHADEACS